MSALRLSTPDCGVRLVDLGPSNGSVNAHVGGHRCVPASQQSERERQAEYQRRHRARKAAAS